MSTDKKDCFAFKDGECVALTKKSCGSCAFYKTTEQVERERKASVDRLKKLGVSEYYRTKYWGLKTAH